VFVLQAQLAWLVDMAAEDISALEEDRRSIGQTVFAELPTAAGEWAVSHPIWLRRFQFCVREYVDRLGQPGPVDPRSLAEEVALHMAFVAVRAEADPDSLLPPDVAQELPSLPGDYAWRRAEEAIAQSSGFRRLYSGDGAHASWPGDRQHPESWFEVF
jgi:hypothetical protein